MKGDLTVLGASSSGRPQRVAAATDSLRVTAADSTDLDAIVIASAASTNISVPNPTDWAWSGRVFVLNKSGGNATLSGAVSPSLTVAANDMAEIWCDGTNVLVFTRTPAGIY